MLERVSPAVLAMFICRGREVSSLRPPNQFKQISIYNWLVFWNIFYFSIQLGIIIPTDFHIFQRDWNHQPDKHGFSKQFAPWMPHNCNLDEFDEDDQAWNFRVPIQIPQKHGHWSSSKGMIWYGRTLRFTNGQPWKFAAWCVENDTRNAGTPEEQCQSNIGTQCKIMQV